MSFDIQIKEFEKTIDEYGTSFLKLEMSGKDMEYPIVNALRKVCMNQIPI
jgi:DNA-directed RNA polymerase alpha subunit